MSAGENEPATGEPQNEEDATNDKEIAHQTAQAKVEASQAESKESKLEQELDKLNAKTEDHQGAAVWGSGIVPDRGSSSRDGLRFSHAFESAVDFEALPARLVHDDPLYSSPSARSIGSASTAASTSPGDLGSKLPQSIRKTLALTQGFLKKYQASAAGYPKPPDASSSVANRRAQTPDGKGSGKLSGAKRSSSVDPKFHSTKQDPVDWLTMFHNVTGYNQDSETKGMNSETLSEHSQGSGKDRSSDRYRDLKQATRPRSFGPIKANHNMVNPDGPSKGNHFNATERCCQKQLRIPTPSSYVGQENKYRNYVLQYATERCVARFPSPAETMPSSQSVFKSVLDGTGWQKIVRHGVS